MENITNRKYFVVDKEKLEERREKDLEVLPIAGCIKQHMISFFPDGTIQIKENLCICGSCIIGHDEKGVVVNRYGDGNEDSNEDNSDKEVIETSNSIDGGDDEEESLFSVNDELIHDMIKPESFAARF